MPKIQLANTGAKTSRSSLLSPVGISGGGPVRTPQINPNAGGSRFTPVTQKVVHEDKIMGSFINAAARLADRQTQLIADEAVLEYSDFARGAYHGKDGKEGYKHLTGANALDAYAGYKDSLNGKYEELIGNLAPAARQKAILRMHDIQDRYQTNGSGHHVNQVKVMEDQVLYVENQDIKKTIAEAGPQAWDDGSVDAHLSKYETPEEYSEAAAELGTYTMYESYNKVLELTGDAEQAYTAAVHAGEFVIPKVDPVGAQKIEHWLLNKRKEAATYAKANLKEATKKAQNELINSTPSTVNELVKNGNYELANAHFAKLRSAFPNSPGKGSKEVVKAFNMSLEMVTLNPGLVGVTSKLSAAEALADTMLSPEQGAAFSADEAADIYLYMNDTLPSAVIKRQKTADTISLATLALGLDAVANGSAPYVPSDAPKGMLSANQERWTALQERSIKDSINGVNYEDMEARGTSVKVYQGKLADYTMKESDIDDMVELVRDGKMQQSQFAEIAIAYEKTKKPGYKKPQYKLEPGYIAGVQSIKIAGKMGIIFPDRPSKKETKKDPTGEFQWQFKTNVAVQTAIAAMDTAAKQASIDKEPFDAQEWWTKYYMDNFNDGKEVGPTFWSKVWGGLEYAAEGRAQQLNHFFTGDSSVFDGVSP